MCRWNLANFSHLLTTHSRVSVTNFQPPHTWQAKLSEIVKIIEELFMLINLDSRFKQVNCQLRFLMYVGRNRNRMPSSSSLVFIYFFVNISLIESSVQKKNNNRRRRLCKFHFRPAWNTYFLEEEKTSLENGEER